MAILAATDGVALSAAVRRRGRSARGALRHSLAPPPLAYATVLRRRPLALLSRAVQRLPLTLISGPAGSGKTVLATCWANAEPVGRTIAWLTLDDYDNGNLDLLDLRDPGARPCRRRRSRGAPARER